MNSHFFSGNYAPIATEYTLDDLPVRGRLPATLSGALYRVGPNPQFPPRDDNYHWFAGDGMVHAFFISKGKVAYRNRWARTPKWALEHEAGRALFGTFGNPATTDPAAAGKSTGTANTNVIWHGGRLFALEESHQPFELDPATLASIGYQDFGGALGARFTAHPRSDPVSGELHFFAYSPDGPGTRGIQYGVLDRDCKLVRLDSFDTPYASMAHDFMLTPERVLFPVLPLTTSIERAMRGRPYFAWESGLRTHIGVMPRAGSVREMRWFDGPPCHAFHMMNAWDEGDTVVALVMQSEVAPGLPNADGSPCDHARAAARLCRWTFDLASPGSGFESDYLDDLAGEFPRIDERFAGNRNTVGFYCAHSVPRVRGDAESIAYDSVVRFDFNSDERRMYSVAPGDVVSEPVFVPRSPAAQEGDGWLMVLAWRHAERRSDLLLLDAADLEAGPAATVALPHRVPFGFHGNWRAA